ncbi:uncharacterized protein LOC124417659 [Gallus gallus]|uniref:uncharacterized protein LOC124417659 n=1 Tax=Gallus gallus TaxID=9031 RepID=UPI001EFFCB03|nr:uncharacterized protein LOC124417659 [Gallus gallus]
MEGAWFARRRAGDQSDDRHQGGVEGFREGLLRIGIVPLAAYYDGLMALVDKGKLSDIIYLDLSEASDVVPHHILIAKLEGCGFQQRAQFRISVLLWKKESDRALPRPRGDDARRRRRTAVSESTLLAAFPDGFPTATERLRYRCAHCSMPLFFSFPPRSLREVLAKKSAPPAPLCPQPDPSLPLSPHTMGAVPHLGAATEERERLSPSPPERRRRAKETKNGSLREIRHDPSVRSSLRRALRRHRCALSPTLLCPSPRTRWAQSRTSALLRNKESG